MVQHRIQYWDSDSRGIVATSIAGTGYLDPSPHRTMRFRLEGRISVRSSAEVAYSTITSHTRSDRGISATRGQPIRTTILCYSSASIHFDLAQRLSFIDVTSLPSPASWGELECSNWTIGHRIVYWGSAGLKFVILRCWWCSNCRFKRPALLVQKILCIGKRCLEDTYYRFLMNRRIWMGTALNG